MGIKNNRISLAKWPKYILILWILALVLPIWKIEYESVSAIADYKTQLQEMRTPKRNISPRPKEIIYDGPVKNNQLDVNLRDTWTIQEAREYCKNEGSPFSTCKDLANKFESPTIFESLLPYSPKDFRDVLGVYLSFHNFNCQSFSTSLGVDHCLYLETVGYQELIAGSQTSAYLLHPQGNCDKIIDRDIVKECQNNLPKPLPLWSDVFFWISIGISLMSFVAIVLLKRAMLLLSFIMDIFYTFVSAGPIFLLGNSGNMLPLFVFFRILPTALAIPITLYILSTLKRLSLESSDT